MGLFETVTAVTSGYSEIADAKAKMAEVEAKKRETEARIEQKNKKHLKTVHTEMQQMIDEISKFRISSKKEELLDQLSELAVQLKANQWQSLSGDDENEVNEAKIRNKFCEALFEKYKQGVRTLKAIDATDPQLEYYQKIQKKTSRKRFFKKYPRFILLGTIFIFSILLLFIIGNFKR